MAPVTGARGLVAFRAPTPQDTLPAWQLARKAPRSGSPSRYSCARWFRDFADTSLVAVAGRDVIGFLIGYRRPDVPDTYCVLRTEVGPHHGTPALGAHLLRAAAERRSHEGRASSRAPSHPGTRPASRRTRSWHGGTARLPTRRLCFPRRPPAAITTRSSTGSARCTAPPEPAAPWHDPRGTEPVIERSLPEELVIERIRPDEVAAEDFFGTARRIGPAGRNRPFTSRRRGRLSPAPWRERRRQFTVVRMCPTAHGTPRVRPPRRRRRNLGATRGGRTSPPGACPRRGPPH